MTLKRLRKKLDNLTKTSSPVNRTVLLHIVRIEDRLEETNVKVDAILAEVASLKTMSLEAKPIDIEMPRSISLCDRNVSRSLALGWHLGRMDLQLLQRVEGSDRSATSSRSRRSLRNCHFFKKSQISEVADL